LKDKNLINLTILFFSLLLFFVSCEKQKAEWKGTVEEVDGVTIVKNPKEPVYEGEILTLEEEFIIDTEEDEIAKRGLTKIVNFAVSSEGEIYFQYDQSSPEYHIFKFDRNGNYVSRFGKSGQGPGEIEMSLSLSINEKDEIFILDDIRRRLLIYDKNGTLIIEKPIDMEIYRIEQLPNGNYLISGLKAGPDGRKFIKGIYNSEFEVIKDIEFQMLPSGKEKINAVRNVFMSSISDDCFFISNVERGYELLACDFIGNLKRKIKKEYLNVKVTEEYRKQIMSALPSELQERYYFPIVFPPFQYFFSDEEGRLFVMTYEKSQDYNGYIYDVFNPDGIFICRISLDNYGKMGPYQIGTPLPARSKNGRIYCLRTKESGYLELVAYKMIWE